MTIPERDPRTLPKAPDEDWWHRAAERIDSAYEAAHALNEQLKAAPRPAAPARSYSERAATGMDLGEYAGVGEAGKKGRAA